MRIKFQNKTKLYRYLDLFPCANIRDTSGFFIECDEKSTEKQGGLINFDNFIIRKRTLITSSAICINPEVHLCFSSHPLRSI